LSIIYDALKKIEQSVHKGSPAKEAQPPKNASVKKKTNATLVFILMVLSGLFIAKTVLTLVVKPKITSLDTAAAGLQPQADIAVVEDAEPEKENIPPVDPALSLSGVYFQNNEGYALINNRIVKSGDVIQGATVKEVGLEKVILEFEGRVITLVSSTQ